jgi:signal transduction histidine kinase
MQRLNSLKTDFLQSVSHEFKTALLGIQGFSELLRDTSELNVEEVRSFATDINRDAVRLDLNALVRREVGVVRALPEQPLIELHLDPALTPVPGDDGKLSEVIRTLLTNAVMRSPASGVVTVTTAAGSAGASVGVKDQGVGVRAEFDDRLFDQDDLYAKSPIRKVVATGLGLGIARQVVQLHGGRMWVVRTPEGGSEYHFTLPVTWRDRIAGAPHSSLPSAVAS